MPDSQKLKLWFCKEVLPLEPALMRFIRNHWRRAEEFTDIRQEVYAKVLAAAANQLPQNAAGYVFATARNVMRNKARQESVVSVELIAEIDSVVPDADWLTPERHLEGREALRRVQEGLDLLPPRCREVMRLRKIEGLGTREVAQRLGVGIDAVQQQTVLGMRALVDFMLGGTGQIERPVRRHKEARGNGK